MKFRLPGRSRTWFLILAALTSGCATGSATVPQPSPFPGARRPLAPSGAEPWALPTSPISNVLATALSLTGQPYLYGGANPATGFDCSGLIWYAFLQNHVAVPRTTADQFQFGREVELSAIEPGDLVFFATTSTEASHVGLALDSHTLVHAPSSGNTVRVERFDTPYWQSRLVGARRIDVSMVSP